MFSKMRETVKKALVGVIVFALGAGLAFIFFAIVYAVFGVLKKDGIVSDIAAILAVVLSAAFGLACALAKPKEKEAAPQDQQPEESIEPAQPDEQPATAVPVGTVKTYKVAGVTHYEQNIMSFAQENPEYSLSKKQLTDGAFMLYDTEKIWKYHFTTPKIELVPEPNNAYDPNAIKVMADGKHVGYIKSGSCSHLLKCIREQRIAGITCQIGGGPYKLLEKEEEAISGEKFYSLEPGKTNLFVHLSVTELPASD